MLPLTVLVKERRRAFSLRDESGAAIPVLGRSQNGELALAALLHAAFTVVGNDSDELEAVAAELRRLVFEPPGQARDALDHFLGPDVVAGTAWASIASDRTCRSLMEALWSSYVLFAALPPGGPNRRILKYTYTEDLERPEPVAWRERLAPEELAYRAVNPDRRRFVVACSGAWRSRSFHAEIVIPEELRFDYAALHDFDTDQPISEADYDADRASLHALQEIKPGREVVAALEIAPDETARTGQATATALAVTVLLWSGALSGLDASNPDATVSILLAGAAIFAGVTAVLTEHRLVSEIFGATRRWLLVVTGAAFVGSVSLALELPSEHPVGVWWIAAAACTAATVRLAWSWLRARA